VGEDFVLIFNFLVWGGEWESLFLILFKGGGERFIFIFWFGVGDGWAPFQQRNPNCQS